MDKVQESGKELLKAKPEMSELVSPKIKDLSNQFDILEKDTHEKRKDCLMQIEQLSIISLELKNYQCI